MLASLINGLAAGAGFWLAKYGVDAVVNLVHTHLTAAVNKQTIAPTK